MLGEVITASVTPFDRDRAIDYDRYRELCEYLVENGSDGVLVSGTTGESPTLSDDERLGLLKTAIDAVGDRATIMAATGTYSTAHSIHLTEQAHEAGADCFLIVTPYYNKPTPRGIVELGLDLYAGDDDVIYPFLEVGGTGGVCVHTHVVGPRVKEMIRLFRGGDSEAARRIDEELAPAIELLRVTTNPIGIKAALNLLGHEVGGLRLPLVEATPDEQAKIRDCLERLGVIEAARV